MFLLEKRIDLVGVILSHDAIDLKVGALKIFTLLSHSAELRKEIMRHWSLIKAQLGSGSAEIQAHALRVLAILYKKGHSLVLKSRSTIFTCELR